MGSTPGSGRSLGGGNGNPLQYSCLEIPMDRGALWATIHAIGLQRVKHGWVTERTHTRAHAHTHTHTHTHTLVGLRQTQFYAYYLGVNINRVSFYVQIILIWTMKYMITPEMMSLITGCNQVLTEGRILYRVIFRVQFLIPVLCAFPQHWCCSTQEGHNPTPCLYLPPQCLPPFSGDWRVFKSKFSKH